MTPRKLSMTATERAIDFVRKIAGEDPIYRIINPSGDEFFRDEFFQCKHCGEKSIFVHPEHLDSCVYAVACEIAEQLKLERVA